MIRLDGIVIKETPSLDFVNNTDISFSVNEIYISKLIHEKNIISPKDMISSFAIDTEYSCIRNIISITEENVLCKGSTDTSFVRIPFDKLILLPLWEEARTWLKNKGYLLNFHYDPIGNDEYIRIGFIKPKNVIIEAEGKTDRECIYKIIYEVIKYENNLS
ncbi:MAG: hypothetical protein KatS3mg068_0425 [Candidatus Sericytochromatia bacterium]|nr:MAG: hypothetical protein KatS3mg068_0425 [Candidatus Sericytochromatia bacterium]